MDHCFLETEFVVLIYHCKYYTFTRNILLENDSILLLSVLYSSVCYVWHILGRIVWVWSWTVCFVQRNVNVTHNGGLLMLWLVYVSFLFFYIWETLLSNFILKYYFPHYSLLNTDYCILFLEGSTYHCSYCLMIVDTNYSQNKLLVLIYVVESVTKIAAYFTSVNLFAF